VRVIQTPPGANLFALAAQYLGDATQWVRIAQQQTPVIVDPFLGASQSLLIPDPSTPPSGGVPAQ
jgi:hypothetical protein